MKNITIKTTPLSDLTNVDNFVDGDNLSVVEVYQYDKLLQARVVNNNEAIAISKNPESIQSVFNNTNVLPILLVKSEYLDYMAKYGRLSMYTDEGEKVSPPKDSISNKYVENANNNQYQFIQMVPNNHSVQIWKSSEGKIYSQPFILDYLYGKISDTYFHLDDFVEKLSHRNDIAFLTYTECFAKEPVGILPCPLKGDENGIGGVINEIEHHIEEGESWPQEKETVTVIFYPSQEDLKKILSWNRDEEIKKPEVKKRRLYNVEQFIIEDILGGKEFLQHPIVEEEETPKRKFKH